MPFQKGNKLAKGRPKGSKNKATDVQKFEIQNIFFNIEEIKRDFQMLSPDKKFDIRMKAMSFFYSRPATEIDMEVKPLPLSMNIETGEYVSHEEQLALRERYGEEPPLFINYDNED
tara:strand:- start:323 stop:670 length:348 start_codon:yes stop_codon:yes gene_type:complete